jgi:uncharacterized protein (TIGR02145 family)
MNRYLLLFFTSLLLVSCSDPNPPSNPQTYQSLTICNKVWMLKNLDVSTYRNGDPIPKVTNSQDWMNLTTGAYCYYNNDSATYAPIYGKLYNWFAVNDPRGLAPVGWHVASDAEWNKLVKCIDPFADTLGAFIQSTTAGGKLKEAGIAHWSSPNVATNETGFTALPGGSRYLGSFDGIRDFGQWWTSTQYSNLVAWDRDMLASNGGLNRRGISNKTNGHSVRCVKD